MSRPFIRAGGEFSRRPSFRFANLGSRGGSSPLGELKAGLPSSYELKVDRRQKIRVDQRAVLVSMRVIDFEPAA